MNLKKATLYEYQKEYDLYMEHPENSGDYIYKTGVWTEDMKPVSLKFPTVYERPSGAEVLADIASFTPQNSHPRIYATPNTMDAIKSRAKRNGLFKESFDELISKADVLMETDYAEYKIPDGIRLLTVSREIRDRVETLGLAYALTEEANYAQRLYEELENAASFKDWNPYHFLDTAEMLAAFAIGYDLCYDYIAKYPAFKETIVDAVKNMGFEPLLDDYLDRERKRTYRWSLSSQPDNWNVVCNGGGILAAIAFAEDLPEYSEQIFEHALPLLEKAVNRFAPDGAWFEGVGYWQYTTKYLCDILSALNNAAGRDYGFSNAEGLRDTGYFPHALLGPGGNFNFSNSGESAVYAEEVFYFANLYGDKRLEKMQYSQMINGNKKLGFKGLLWYKGNYDNEVSDLPLDFYFRDSEVVSMRSSYDSNANFAAICGGANYVPHAHLDVGSFVLDMAGVRFGCDLGSENYNLKTTYPWEPYRNRAEGHNTLVINPDINPDQNDEAFPVINRFDSSDDGAIAVVDMTEAYCDDVKSAVRGMKMHSDRNAVLLQDEIKCIEPSVVWWFMHTKAKISVSADGKTATLTKDGVKVNAKLLTDGGKFVVMNAKPLSTSPQNSSQNQNTAYRKLAIRYDDVTDLNIAVEFTPADSEIEESAVKPICEW